MTTQQAANAVNAVRECSTIEQRDITSTYVKHITTFAATVLIHGRFASFPFQATYDRLNGVLTICCNGKTTEYAKASLKDVIDMIMHRGVFLV